MIKFRVVIVILFVAITTFSCTKESVPSNTPVDRESAQQVTLAYFIGTSLKSFYNTNVYDTASAIGDGCLGKCGRFYYFMPTSATVATLYELQENEDGTTTQRVVMNYTLPSGDPETMEQVIKEVQSDVEWGAGAEMNMIVSGHGAAWLLADHTTLSYQEDRMQMLSSFGDNGSGITPCVTRYIGDGGSHGYLNISDFCDVFTECGVKLGYMLFDSCFMSSVEVAYRLRAFTDYIIASPSEVMGTGFPYENVLPLMFKENGTKYDLKSVCHEYYNYYNDGHSSDGKRSACVALCVTSELEQLASVMSRIHKDDVSTYDIQRYVPSSKTYKYPFYDLNGYIKSATSASDYQLFVESLERAYPSECRLHTDRYYSQYNGGYNEIDDEQYSGVTTSAPATAYSDYNDWLKEPWAVDTTY